MPKRSSRKDINQLAAFIVEHATADPSKKRVDQEQPKKNQAAVELGRMGGKKGGKARAEKLTPEKRSEIARKAAKARWDTKITQQPSNVEVESSGQKRPIRKVIRPQED